MSRCMRHQHGPRDLRDMMSKRTVKLDNMSYRANTPEPPKPKEPSDMHKIYLAFIKSPAKHLLLGSLTGILAMAFVAACWLTIGWIRTDADAVTHCYIQHQIHDNKTILWGNVPYHMDNELAVSSCASGAGHVSCISSVDEILAIATKVCPGGKVGR